MSKNNAQLKSVSFSSSLPGKRLIVLGAVHGNETCGTRAIERVIAEFESGGLQLLQGQVTFVPITNPLAYQLGQRAGERNLNRNLRPVSDPIDYEDEIANILCPLLAAHDVLLDLHSFHAPGEAFVMLGPENNNGTLEPFQLAAEEEALALRLGPRRLVDGWLDTYAHGVKQRLKNANASARAQMLSTDPTYGIGTTEYMRAQGGYAITLECGQHQDPNAPEVAYQAIRNTLAHVGLVALPAPQPHENFELLRIDEVVDRADKDDSFSKQWVSFDWLNAGDMIGCRADASPVKATRPGFILFPNPNALPGNEWFYYAKLSERMLDGKQGNQ